MPIPARILVADDQPDVLAALKLLLKSEGFQAKAVDSPAGVVAALRAESFDLLLIDLNYTRDTTSGHEGLDLLEQIQTATSAPPVLVMTAWGSMDLAVEAMRRGARDFVLKPWDNEKLLEAIRSQIAREDAAGRSRAAKDMELARQVQAKLMPQRLIPMSTLDYTGRCIQAGQVGGDYFDYLSLGTGRLGLVLADISGKGMGAALLMSNLQAALRSLSWQIPQNLGVLLRTLNLQFRETTETHHFATLFLADYDDSSRRLRYANCGHNPPLLWRAASSTIETLQPTAPIVGVFEWFQPTVEELTLEKDDLLIVYSDGVIDSVDANDKEFGDAGLQQWLAQNHNLTPSDFIANLASHCLTVAQPDDFTVVVARAR